MYIPNKLVVEGIIRDEFMKTMSENMRDMFKLANDTGYKVVISVGEYCNVEVVKNERSRK